MRYIVVFAKQGVSYAVGFDEFNDATDFLYWGYEDYELVPHGVFDVLTGETWPYEHQGERVVDVDRQAISQAALDYLRSAMRRAG